MLTEIFLIERRDCHYTGPAWQENASMEGTSGVAGKPDFSVKVRPGCAARFVDGGPMALVASLESALGECSSSELARLSELTTGRTVVIDNSAAHPEPAVGSRGLARLVVITPFNDARGDLAGAVVSSAEALPQASLAAPAAITPENEPTIERMKQQLLATVSHELRTPLSGIQSWTHVLKKVLSGAPRVNAAQSTDVLGDQGSSTSDQAARALSGIIAGVDRQVAVVDELIDAAQVLSGDVVLRRSVFTLSDAVSDALSTLHEDICAARLRIERRIVQGSTGSGELRLEADDNWQTVSGDRERVALAIRHLLSNAIKFSTKHEVTQDMTQDVIRVSIEGSGIPQNYESEENKGGASDEAVHVVSLTVEDRGAGIAPDALINVFSSFYQADQSISRTSEGLGLGLSIARGVARAHGGDVRAESAGAGWGARFTLSLPIVRGVGTIHEVAMQDASESSQSVRPE